MKRFFYVTFDSLNFALVAGISFSLRVAGAQNKANLDINTSLVTYLYNLIPIVVAPKCFCRTDIYALGESRVETSTYMYVFGIQRVNITVRIRLFDFITIHHTENIH